MRRALPCLVFLAGCGAQPAADNSIAPVDPAVTTALNDPLMVDPLLEQRHNRDALKPADEPYRALLPPGQPDPLRGELLPTIAARSAAYLAEQGKTACLNGLSYSYGWAATLALPLPADARVAEAAGNDRNGCALWLVAYSSTADPARIEQSYRSVAGYTVESRSEEGATVLRGRKGAEGFRATIYPASGGSAVDVVATAAR